MKFIVLGVLVVAAMMIAGCGDRDLPPEPNPPGAIGQAGGGDNPQPQFPTDPRFTVDFNPLVVDEAQQSATQSISIDSQVIWHTAYYLSYANTQAGEWVPFEISGQEPIQNWFKTDATGDYTFHTDFLYNDSIDWSAVIAYSCEKSEGIWDCHNNQWIIDMFDVVMSECTPGQSRCNADGSTLEECSQNYVWTTVEVCGAGLCYELLGGNQAWCGDCQIGETTCEGETGFLTCNTDGSWSMTPEMCDPPQTCVDGACGFDLPSDPTAPSGQSNVLTITSPQSGGTLTQVNTISGEYTIGDNHIQSFIISVNGEAQQLDYASGAFSKTVTISTQGANAIAVEMVDAWGTTYTDSIQLTYGGMPNPYIITLEPVQSPTNQNTIPLSGTVTENGIPASDVQVNIVSEPVTMTATTDATGTFNTVMTLPESNRQYIFSAVALAGDGFPSEPAIIEVWHVDQIPDTTVYPDPSEVYNTVNEIIIEANQIDNAVLSLASVSLTSGISNYQLGYPTTTSCGDQCMRFTTPIVDTLDSGTYIITYDIVDSAGNTERRTSSFTIDSTAPLIFITTPAVFTDPQSEESLNGLYTTMSEIMIEGAISGVGISSANDIASHNFDMVFDCSEGVCFNTDLNLPSGTTQHTLTVTDSQGRTGMRTLVFHSPIGQQPWMSITSPLSGNTFTAVNMIYGTYNMDDQLIQSMTIQVNNEAQGDLQYSDGTFAHAVTIPEGTSIIEVGMTDAWGSTYTDSIDLTYGGMPVGYLVDPVFLQSPTNSNMVTLEGVVIDLNTGTPAADVPVEIDSEGSITTTMTDAAGVFSATVPLSQSNHYYIFSVVALAGDGFPSEPAIQELWRVNQIMPTTVYPESNTVHNWIDDIRVHGTQVDGADLSISDVILLDAGTYVQYQLGSPNQYICGDDCVGFRMSIYTQPPDGQYIIRYTLSDTLQTEVRESMFSIDKTAPAINIINPAAFSDPTSDASLNGLYVTDDHITVTGTVSGVGISDISSIAYHNFDSIFSCSAGSGVCFNKEVWLPQGTSNIVLFVEDTQGRFGERELIFHRQ